MMRRGIGVVVFLLATACAQAATYQIAIGAQGAASQFSRMALKPGDSVMLERGGNFSGGQWILPASGTAAAPITLGAFGDGPAPVLDGGNDFANSRAGTIIGVGRSYWIIQDLDVRAQWSAQYSRGRGIVLERGQGNIIQRCEISGGAYDENIHLVLGWGSKDVKILKNNVHGGQYGVWLDAPDGAGYSGLVAGNSISDLNRGTASDWDGIKVGRSGPPLDFSGLIIAGNDVSNFEEDGIDLYNVSGVVAAGNYIHDSGSARNHDNQSGAKSTQANEFIANRIERILGGGKQNRYGILETGAGGVVAENVIAEVRSSAIFAAQGVVLRNNAVYGSIGSLCNLPVFDAEVSRIATEQPIERVTKLHLVLPETPLIIDGGKIVIPQMNGEAIETEVLR